jgi:hypothetical protein
MLDTLAPMAKSKRKSPHRLTARGIGPAALGFGIPHIALGYDPRGQMEPVDVAIAKEGWSEFTLVDGTTIRAKAVLLDVKHAVGQYNAEGDPIYVMNLTVVNQVKAPENMQRKKS